MKITETVSIDELAPGQVVCEPVLDPAGRILVPVGTVINEMTIVGLRRREVASVRVEREVAESAADLAEAQQRIAGQLDRLFRLAGDSPEIRLVYQAVLAYRMEHR